MNRLLALSLIAGLLMACPVAGSAEESAAKYTLSLTKAYTPSLWTEAHGYKERAKHKLIFASKNTLFGWAELYDESKEAYRQEHEGVMKGFGRGLVNMLGDTVGGAVQLTTFPITAFDAPLPEGGTNVL